MDPLSDGSFTVVDGRLEIGVPSGAEHFPWDVADVPRVMHPLPDGDLAVEASVGAFPAQWYQGSGLLFEQDSDNFVTFEVYHDGDDPALHASSTADGSTVTELDVEIPDGGSIALRVSRKGELWVCEFSFDDGAIWYVAGAFHHELEFTRAGLYAGNGEDENSPAHTAAFEDISNSYTPASSGPGGPGDPGSTAVSEFVYTAGGDRLIPIGGASMEGCLVSDFDQSGMSGTRGLQGGR